MIGACGHRAGRQPTGLFCSPAFATFLSAPSTRTHKEKAGAAVGKRALSAQRLVPLSPRCLPALPLGLS